MEHDLTLRITVSVHQGWERISLDECVIEMTAESDALERLAQVCGSAVQGTADKAVRAASAELARIAAEEAEAEGASPPPGTKAIIDAVPDDDMRF